MAYVEPGCALVYTALSIILVSPQVLFDDNIVATDLPASSSSVTQSIDTTVSSSPDTNDRLQELIEEARYLSEQSQLNRSDSLLKVAMDLADQLQERLLWGEGLLLHIENLVLRGEISKAIELAEEHFEEFWQEEVGIKLGNILATAYRFDGSYHRSLELYEEVLERIREEGDRRDEAGVEQNMAVVYNNLGDQSAALERYYNSLEIAEEIGDVKMQAVILNNIGSLYRNLDEFERAEQFHTESLELSREIDSKIDIIRATTNLGIVYKEQGDFDRAIEYYTAALSLDQELGRVEGPIRTLHNLAEIYIEQGNLELAESKLLESLERSQEINLFMGLYFNNFTLGRVYTEMGDYEQALRYLQRTLELAEQSGSVEMERDITERISHVYELSGDIEQSHHYLKRYISLQDSLHSLDKEESLARYETLLGLRSERQERELLEEKVQAQNMTMMIGSISLAIILIALAGLIYTYMRQRTLSVKLANKNSKLEKLNREVRMQKDKLTDLNESKNNLISILSHDLRIPITQLHGLVALIRQGYGNKAEMDKLLNHVERSMQYSILTLENYLNWALNQKGGVSPDMTSVNLRDKSDEVLGSLQQIADGKNIRITNQVEDELEVDADEDMLRVILQNLVYNALKYTGEGGAVILNSKLKNSKCVLVVSDDGIGIPAEKQDQIFEFVNSSSPGTELESGTGLGLSICKELAENQNGQIWFESREGEGTKFYLELSLATTVD